jgi:hypothetical protein
MKIILALVVFLSLNTLHMSGQTSLGLRLGFPMNHPPARSPILVLPHDLSQEFLFNVSEDRADQYAGLILRHDIDRFWFAAEGRYGKQKTKYELRYTYRANQENQTEAYDLEHSIIQFQGSIGAKLDFLEIFSGMGMGFLFNSKNEFDRIMLFRAELPKTSFSWHTGVGVQIGHVVLDICYQQTRQNYGTGIFFGEKELRLKNLPGGFIVSVAFMM